MGYLIDTTLWSELERGRLSPEQIIKVTGDTAVYVSPVSIAEMKFGSEMASKADIRQQRLAGVAKMMTKAVLPIDLITGEIFGDLAAQLRKTGRGHEFRTQDIWLASQAIQHGLIFLTHNSKDFRDIPGLRLQLIKQAR